MQGERVPIPPVVSEEHAGVVKLLQACWAEDANERPCAAEAVDALEKLLSSRYSHRVSMQRRELEIN